MPGLHAAIHELTHLMDALAVDEREDPPRCEAIRRGLEAVLGAETTHVLAEGALSPAEIAARFFRLQELVELLGVLERPRVG